MIINETFKERITYIVQNYKPEQYASIIKLKHTNKDLCSWIIQETSFLPENVRMTERVFCIQNNIIKALAALCCQGFFQSAFMNSSTIIQPLYSLLKATEFRKV